MILVDANLLVYAHVSSSPQHEVARSWLDKQINGTARVGLPWPSLLAFVRLVTNPKIFSKPEPIAAAWGQVEEWIARPPCWIPQATEQHATVVRKLLPFVTRSELVPDAHLAALAIEHGLIVCSADGDFARFPGVRWNNPLMAGDR